jgi:Uma2 family endonuclease
MQIQITRPSVDEVYYPDTDGKPMAESDLHRELMFYIIHRLQRYFAGEHIYVTGNLLLYYERGNRYKSIAPDCFVVWDIEPKRRRVYKLWEEGKGPAVVFEVTSKSTQREDFGKKMELYAKLGVQEYFIYDPTREYLDPPLVAFVRSGSGFIPMQPVKEVVSIDTLDFVPGASEPPEYISQLLGVRLVVDEVNVLQFYDLLNGERLLDDSEARDLAEAEARDAIRRAAEEQRRADEEQQRADEEQQRADEEQRRANEERQRAELAEAEVARLQAELARLRSQE